MDTCNPPRKNVNGLIFPSNCMNCYSYSTPSGKNPIANGYPSLYVNKNDFQGRISVLSCGVYKRV
jgi:hypothetical protein